MTVAEIDYVIEEYRYGYNNIFSQYEKRRLISILQKIKEEICKQ